MNTAAETVSPPPTATAPAALLVDPAPIADVATAAHHEVSSVRVAQVSTAPVAPVAVAPVPDTIDEGGDAQAEEDSDAQESIPQQDTAGSETVPQPPQQPAPTGDLETKRPVAPVAPVPVGPRPAPVTPTPTPARVESRPPEAQSASTDTGDTERPESEKPTDQLLLDRGGVLLPPGMFQLEPAAEFTRITSDRVAISGFTIFDAIVIGTIRVDDLQRDLATPSLTARIGILNRVQAEVRVPYVYRRDKEVFAAGTTDAFERVIQGTHLGDIEASISFQPLAQDGWVPATILRGRGRFPTGRNAFEIPRVEVAPAEFRLSDVPTGSGFYGVGAGATFVWRADPAVFFIGGGYTYNLENTFPDFGTITPGNTVEIFAGVNFALSEVVSLNVSLISQSTDNTAQNGIETPGSATDDARLVIGTSIAIGPSTSILVSAGSGLTDQSPDFTLSVSIPLSFQLY